MAGFGGFLILLAIFCVLSGPIALIVSIVAIRRLKELDSNLHELSRASRRQAGAVPTAAPQRLEPARTIEPRPVFEEIRHETITQAPAATSQEAPRPAPQPVSVGTFFQKDTASHATAEPVPLGTSLEQRIGTRWVLIAGVITVMFAVGFFLKYAYEQHWIDPRGRVLIAGFSGLVALAIGEVTRRRGYDIVAKGVTALGFAILYATVFAAHRWYGLIGSPTAFALAIAITAGAMLYAVVLDEIVIAMLSLIGGYLTPVVLATGQNLPMLLFSYVLILSAGAVACAYWRKWSPVNILVFVGTYLLYTGWFERFYRPVMGRMSPPEQLGVALFWLAVFFLIYLMLPLLHTLVRRIKSAPQDMVLVLANAAVVFYYLWTILHHDYQAALAWCSVGMGAAHLALAAAVFVRCREDSNLWQVLVVTGVAFITLAVPLYFEVYAIAMLWAVEALLLIVVGLRYRHLGVQVAGVIVLMLTVGDLLTGLPLHKESFPSVFNTAFAAWCFVAAAVMVCHVLYRLDKHLEAALRSISAQAFYVAGLGLLMTAVAMELWWHQELNMSPAAGPFFWEQMVLAFAAFIPLLVARPICPRGQASRVLGTLLAGAGAVYILVTLPRVHEHNFTVFVNGDFARAILLVAVLFASARLLRRTERREPDEFVAAAIVAIGATIVLWILLTEEIWLYYDRLRPGPQWRFLARMYIAMLWAAYATALIVVAFWRRVQLLQYLAIGILVLAVGDLLTGLPMHTTSFSPVFNTAFGAWCSVAAAMIACHMLYRFDKHLDANLRSASSQGFYVAGLGLLVPSVTMELWWHAALNAPAGKHGTFFWEQMVLVFAVFILLFIARPICPRGQAARVVGTLLAGAAAIYILVTLPGVHGRSFTMFVNGDFARAILLVAVLFASARLLRRTERREPDEFVAAAVVAIGAIIVLWILLTEEIWLYYDRMRPSAQWRFLAQMYISVLWAVYATALMVVGFWRRVRPLRYLALGIFVLLLAKIFLIDTRELETMYRIAGFLATGLALVGVSYLYQYLKKTGFFDTMLAEKDTHS